MAFDRPTLAEIVTRTQSDFVSRLSLVGAVLRRSLVSVLGRVIAGVAHMLHGHLDFLSRQIFPDLSDDAYLVRQASVFGISKTPPTFATATAGITGIDPTVCPAGTVLIRSDGAEYTVDADVTVTGNVGTVDVTAALAGSDGTLTADIVLSFQAPISGIDSTATVASSVADGTDEEATEALRVRLLEHLAEPAHGGSDADYVAWAKEISGVTRVWVTRQGLGPGTVVVRFVRDNDAGPIPDAGEVAAVQAKLNTEAPAHATVTAVAPVSAPVAFSISVTPNTVAIQTAVSAELTDLFLRVATPGRTMLLSELRTAIGATAGVVDYTLTTPASNVTHTTNQLPALGTVTWS